MLNLDDLLTVLEGEDAIVRKIVIYTASNASSNPYFTSERRKEVNIWHREKTANLDGVLLTPVY